jgi:hypothetical protein
MKKYRESIKKACAHAYKTDSAEAKAVAEQVEAIFMDNVGTPPEMLAALVRNSMMEFGRASQAMRRAASPGK